MKKIYFLINSSIACLALLLATTQTGFAQCPAGSQQVCVEYTAGTFPGENSWMLWDATAGAELICTPTGAATGSFPVCAPNGNNLELYVWESFGDGWNGAEISVEMCEDGSVNGCPAQAFEIVPPYTVPNGADFVGGNRHGTAICGSGPFVGGPGFAGSAGMAGFPIPGADPASPFSVVCPPPCLDCPADIVVSTDPGVCEANVVVPPPVFADATCFKGSCDPLTETLVEGPAATLNMNATGLITTAFSLPGVPSALVSCQNEVCFDVLMIADIGGAGFEQTDILGENGMVLGQNGTSAGDCNAAGGLATFCVPAATYLTWAADGVINFTIVTDADIDNICATQTIQASASFCNDCIDYTNDLNGGQDASGTFPIGTTCITYNATGSGSGGTVCTPLTCTVKVTVEDQEAPILSCPGDFTYNLQGGECCQIVNYNVSSADNCPFVPSIANATQYDNAFCNCDDVAANFFLACSGGFPNPENHVIQILPTPPEGEVLMEVCYNLALFGNQAITINAYCYDGVNIPFDDGAGTYTPFATGDFPVDPATSGTCACFDFTMGGTVLPGAVPAGCAGIAIEVINAAGATVDMSTTSGCGAPTGADTYLVSAPCGLSTPASVQSIGFAVDAAFNASFAPIAGEPVATDPADAPICDPTWTVPVFPADATINAFDSGEEFPIGEHCFFYTASDVAGNKASCQWCVTVNEVPEDLIVTSLACNDHVNISLNEECEVFVSADMFLEGGPYGCYFECYEVYITDESGANVSGGCGADAVKGGNTNPNDLNGCTIDLACGLYTVQVYDACNDNTCWGTLLVEDKIAPIVVAPEDVTLNCLQSVEPGTPLFGTSAGSLEPGDYSWGDLTTGAVVSTSITIPPATTGAIITDINIEVGLDHSWMGDVVMTLTGPDGSTITMLDNCGNVDNTWAIFDEEASNGPACAGGVFGANHETCTDPANYTIGSGIGNGNSIKTFDGAAGNAGLATFNGLPVGGTYTIDIMDTANGDGGCLQLVNFSIEWECPAPAVATVENPCGSEDIVYTDQYFDNGCNGSFIERTWTATDEKGNSGQAVQNITITQIGLAGEGSEWFWPAGIVDLTCGSDSSPEGIYTFFSERWAAMNAGVSPGDEFDCNMDAAGVRMAYPFFFNKKGLQERFDINNCNMFYTYSDQVLPVCGPGCDGNNKVIRTWTALDWCTGETSTSLQVIHAKDNEGPSFDAPAPITVSASPWGCAASFTLPAPLHLSDNCSADVTYVVYGAPGTVTETNAGPVQEADGSWRVYGLPKGGPHEYIYVAEDCCGNKTSNSVFVTVVDGTAPIAIAKQNIVISLTSSPTDADGGIAKLYAASVDNGSHDGDCGPVKYFIRRTDEDDMCGSDGLVINSAGDQHNNNSTFTNFNDLANNIQNGLGAYDPDDTDGGEYVKFCCSDLTGPNGVDEDGDGVPDYALIDVELAVWDDSDMDGWPASSLMDAWSVTWAQVRVEAKLAPNLACPPLVKLTCEMDETDLSVTGVATGGSTCGTLNTVYTDLCGLDINQDGEIANFKAPNAMTINEVGMCTDVDGDGVIANWTAGKGDNVREDLFNKACHYGPITRWWSIEGTNIQCRQIIILEEPTTSFAGSGMDLNDDGDCNDFGDVCPVIDWPYSKNNFINLANNDGACGGVSSSDIEVVPDRGAYPDYAEVLMDCIDDLCDEPIWVDANCSLVGWSLDSDTFYFEGDACRKIINTYTVIDWCQYDPNSVDGEGIWTWTVIGKLLDTYAPVVTSDDGMFPAGAGQGGSGSTATVSGCVGTATATATATDTSIDEDGNVIDNACPSQWLKWNVYLDINNDWRFDREWSSFVAEDKNTTADPLWSEDNAADNIAIYGYTIPDVQVGNTGDVDNATDFATEPGFAYTINIPDAIAADCGETQHRVVWKVYDGCGNVTSTTSYFTVQDTKAPTPYCINLSTALMADPDGAGPLEAMVELWAIDFDAGSFDNCTADGDLQFTFTDTPPSDDPDFIEASRSSARVFTCGDLQGATNQVLAIPVYVWDGCGNYDFCIVNLRLIDNTGCGSTTGTGSRIAGDVSTELGVMVEDVEVANEDMILEFPTMDMTDTDGTYAFDYNSEGHDFQVTASKDGDDLNGVSTLDLVLIQRHILGIESLDSPYKLLAADVNNDGAITALDLIEIRKLILGIYSEYPSVDSWMFVDAAQTIDMSNPTIYDESIDIYNLSTDMINEDFIAVKMGDVNSSVQANSNEESIESRSAASIEVEFDDQDLTPGMTFDLVVNANSMNDVYGYQFTLATPGLELVNITAGAVNVSEANFGVFNGELTSSWNNVSSTNIDGEMFTLTFKSNVESRLSEILDVNSSLTRAEAYVGSNLDIVNVNLRGGDSNSSSDFALYQNEPNPFTNKTVIGFDMPESADATMTILDVTGKVIKTITGNYAAGYNQIELSKSDLGAAGVLYYQLDSGDFTATKKMIIIE